MIAVTIHGIKQADGSKQIKDKEIAEALQLPPIKLHCSVLAESGIKKAIEDWEAKEAQRKHNQYDDKCE